MLLTAGAETSALFCDLNKNKERSKIELDWNCVDYYVTSREWKLSWKPLQSSSKKILKNVSGKIESESLTAIIGPSGAGKSSLLEILAGRRVSGVCGNVTVNFNSSKDASKAKIAFMGQKDLFYANLSVHETLMFASKLKNYSTQDKMMKRLKTLEKSDVLIMSFKVQSEARNFHVNLVNEILEELNLTSCADVRVGNCSGGQQKRLSIACELVSRPDILLLDEPTSGLDSFSAFQCIQLLKKLTKTKSLAVILSIHQPSSKTLNLFDRLYVLSHDGQCIYNGQHEKLLPHLKDNGFECPVFYNPADFICEIASGDHGKQAITKLCTLTTQEPTLVPNGIPLTKVMEKMMKKPLPLWSHTWTLLKRSLIVTIRDPMLSTLSLFQHIFVGLIMGTIYSQTMGTMNGCYKSQHVNPSHYSIETLKAFQEEESVTGENVGFLFFSLIFLFLASMMATVLTFPLEMGVFVKERTNRWYSCCSYYLARTMADTPFRIVYPLVYSIIIYRMTGQLDDTNRFIGFILLNILVAFVAQSKGLLIGALYANQVDSAVFVAPLSTVPVILFGGFFVNLSGLPAYLSCLPLFSYFKYAFDASVTLIYGFSRCEIEMPMDTAAVVVAKNVSTNAFYDLFKTFEAINISLSDVSPMIEFYLESKSVKSKIIDDVVAKIAAVENSTKTLLQENTKSNLTSTSYIMKHFNLIDDTFHFDIVALILFLILFRVASYLILLHKSSPRK